MSQAEHQEAEGLVELAEFLSLLRLRYHKVVAKGIALPSCRRHIATCYQTAVVGWVERSGTQRFNNIDFAKF